MKKQDRVTLYENNIIEFINSYVDVQDIDWYGREHENLTFIANTLHIPPMLFIAIVASVSPMSAWKKTENYYPNVECAIGIVKNTLGLENDARLSSTNSNKQKAMNMLKFWLNNGTISENDFLGVSGMLSGPKVEAFYSNLMYPHRADKITVDVWMERIASRQHGGKTNERTSDFNAILEAYEHVVNRLQCIPHKLQAALWVKIKHSDIAKNWLLDYDNITFLQCGV